MIDILEQGKVWLVAGNDAYNKSKIGRDIVRQALKADLRVVYFSTNDHKGLYESEEIWTEYVKRTGKDISYRAFKACPLIGDKNYSHAINTVQQRIRKTDKNGNLLLQVVEGRQFGYSMLRDIRAKANNGFKFMVINGEGLCENYKIPKLRRLAADLEIAIIIID